MSALSSNQRAILTCRAGKARAGASRFGFAPANTDGGTAGSSGGFYIWQTVNLPSTVWTVVRNV